MPPMFLLYSYHGSTLDGASKAKAPSLKPSFPRQRESRAAARRLARWTPACAGVTIALKAFETLGRAGKDKPAHVLHDPHLRSRRRPRTKPACGLDLLRLGRGS